MSEEYTMDLLRRKVKRINEAFGKTIDIERLNGSYRACPTPSLSSNLTPLGTKREVFLWLDMYEKGLEEGCKEGIK